MVSFSAGDLQFTMFCNIVSVRKYAEIAYPIIEFKGIYNKTYVTHIVDA